MPVQIFWKFGENYCWDRVTKSFIRVGLYVEDLFRRWDCVKFALFFLTDDTDSHRDYVQVRHPSPDFLGFTKARNRRFSRGHKKTLSFEERVGMQE